MKLTRTWLLVSMLTTAPGWGDNPGGRLADRAVIEQVYQSHRIGTNKASDEALAPGLLERLVRQDVPKEASGSPHKLIRNIS